MALAAGLLGLLAFLGFLGFGGFLAFLGFLASLVFGFGFRFLRIAIPAGGFTNSRPAATPPRDLPRPGTSAAPKYLRPSSWVKM